MKTDMENILKIRAEHETQFAETQVSHHVDTMRPFVAARWGYACALVHLYGRRPLQARMAEVVSGEGTWQ